MRILALLWLFAYASGQSLTVPPTGIPGQPLEIKGQGFPPGSYVLELFSPVASENISVLAPKGEFRVSYTPKSSGKYGLKLKFDNRVLENSFLVGVLGTPRLEADGLHIGDWRLPLKGSWLGPLVVGSRAFIAQGPLILEIDLLQPRVINRHYPPLEVVSLEKDPASLVPTALLAGSRRLSLNQFSGLPYEGRWESLSVLRDYEDYLLAENALALDQSPKIDRPYWYFLVQDPNKLVPADLEAFGKDLLKRGHRPELAWGDGVMRYLKAWVEKVRTARKEGLEASLAWSDTLLAYLPQFPGSIVLFREQAQWLDNQGRPDLAMRYQKVAAELASWQVPWTPTAARDLAFAAFSLYLVVFLYLLVSYLPAQTRELRKAGGWLFSWFLHPGLRIRHSVMAYATLTERLQLLLLVFIALASFLIFSFSRKAEATMADEAFSRGTLRSTAAEHTLRNLPQSSGVKGLLGYSLVLENPAAARQLLAAAPRWPVNLVNLGTPQAMDDAQKLAPRAGVVLEASGLGGDFYSGVYRSAGIKREAVPTPRSQWLAFHVSGLEELAKDPLKTWLSLPVFTAPWQAWVSVVFILLLLLNHLASIFLVRPKAAANFLAWRRGMALLFPGSLWYGQGWGVVLLLVCLAGVGLLRTSQALGLFLLSASLLVHLSLWLFSAERPGKAA